MKEYISIDYLYSILTPRLLDSNGAEHYAYDCLKQEIDYAPDSEIVHFEHGQWLEYTNRDGTVQCSHCGLILESIAECFKYCPNCGAMMREENSNGYA